MDLNIGYNFDRDLPPELDKLNKQFARGGDRISSVYGSIRKHAWLSARPDFRLPDITENELRMHIEVLADIGIEFNYALNSPNPAGSKTVMMDRKPEFIGLCRRLVNMGVKRFIISDPMLIEILRRDAPEICVEIELSTIMHIDTPMQLVALKQLDDRIARVVGNILYNRDFRKLKAFASVCKKLDIEYEVMVNEFCLTATGKSDVPIAAHCVYRDSCYGCHATNITKDDALSLHNYPMGKCMTGRAGNAADWLRTYTARPQDLHYYEDIGITNFKITGRTGTTEYIQLVSEGYLSRTWNHNLLELWKPLETIYNDKPEAEHKHRFNIPTEQLDGFFKPFAEGTIDCNIILCENCLYCDGWVNRLGIPS